MAANQMTFHRIKDFRNIVQHERIEFGSPISQSGLEELKRSLEAP